MTPRRSLGSRGLQKILAIEHCLSFRSGASRLPRCLASAISWSGLILNLLVSQSPDFAVNSYEVNPLRVLEAVQSQRRGPTFHGPRFHPANELWRGLI